MEDVSLNVKPKGKPSKQFCPMCGSEMNYKQLSGLSPSCNTCKWTDYENPVPVACVLASYKGDPLRRVVMVKRGVPPFKGEWCLPCGYMNKHEIPKDAACREMKEETGLEVRLEKILCVCNPMPREINQITVSYLARITSDEINLKNGDDAEDARLFGDVYPTPCFRSHKMLMDKWWAGRLGEITGVDLD
jgi:8-oxo-dGTP diphosphatase